MLTVINDANVFFICWPMFLTLTQATEGLIYPQGGFYQNLIQLSAEC